MEERAGPKSPERSALIFDDEKNGLGELALRLIRLGIDVHYAKDRDEAVLLGQQESARIRALLFPVDIDLDEMRAVCAQIDAGREEPQVTPVAVGDRPDKERLAQLREAGVNSALWEPYDDSALRFVVTQALTGASHGGSRREERLPTTLSAKAFVGVRSKEVIVYTLSPLGAFLETPHPFPEGTTLRLEMEFPHGVVLIKADVVYARSARDEGPPDQPNGMGVAFTNLDSFDEKRITDFLREQLVRSSV